MNSKTEVPKMGLLIQKLRESNEFCEGFKSAILANTVIRIRNEREDVVWCCADDVWRDERFSKFTVDQDMNLYAVIAALEQLVSDHAIEAP